MASEIKDLYSAAAALNIDLAGLVSSVAGVGNQSDMVDNSNTRFERIRLFIKSRLGTSPTADTAIYIFLLRGDKHGTPYRTDGAAATKGALTILNAGVVGVIRTKHAPSTGDDLYADFDILKPGPEWGICVVHDTVAALNATAGNHFVHWIGLDPQ